MNKEEALDKIRELVQFVEEIDNEDTTVFYLDGGKVEKSMFSLEELEYKGFKVIANDDEYIWLANDDDAFMVYFYKVE